MIPTADPYIFIEEQREGYVRYQRSDGARWEVGVCDHRGDCMVGAVIDGHTVTPDEAPLLAMTTITYSGTTPGKWSEFAEHSFTTNRVGDITVTAHFHIKANGAILLYVHDDPKTGIECKAAVTKDPSVTEAICTIPNAAAGNYVAAIRSPYGGRVDYTLDVTAETD